MASIDQPKVADIDALLPQTQCTKCGYPGCRPYAEAISSGTADINQCPPGGESGIRALAILLGRPYIPLNPANGVETPRRVAVIDEQSCIGCTLCIQVCPVDAIVGSAKYMHTVITDHCTGCNLCLPPCPVDCITMAPMADGDTPWTVSQAGLARKHHERREQRLRSGRDMPDGQSGYSASSSSFDAVKQTLAMAAIARARAKRRKSALR